MRKLISVIVPVYNIEKYIRKCIESLLNQTYSNLEIILVDDGSIDQGGEICDSYEACDTRIRVIHKENGGLSDARNKGMSIARGSLISFVDGDDWVEKEYFEVLAAALEENNADIAISGINDIYLEKTSYCESGNVSVGTGDDAIKNTLQQVPFFRNCVWNKLYKKDCIGEYTFPFGKYYEDVLYTIQAYKGCGKYILTTNTAYNYVVERQDSIMNKKVPEEHILDAVEQYEQRDEFFPENKKKEYTQYNDLLEIKQILLAWRNLLANEEIKSKKAKKKEIYTYVRKIQSRSNGKRRLLLQGLLLGMRVAPRSISHTVTYRLKKNKKKVV